MRRARDAAGRRRAYLMGLAAWGFPWPFPASPSVALALYLGGAAGGLLMARRAAGVETAGWAAGLSAGLPGP